VRPAVARATFVAIAEDAATPATERTLAAHFVASVALAHDLPLVRSWLDDDLLCAAASGILDKLAWGGHVTADEAEPLLRVCEAHSNEYVRETAAFIRGYQKPGPT